MPVRIRVVAKGEAVLIFQSHQAGHSVRAGAVHPDLAVVIQCHEGEGGVLRWIDVRYVETVRGVDGLPTGEGSAAQRVHRELEASAADRLHINDTAEVVDVWEDKVPRVRRRG